MQFVNLCTLQTALHNLARIKIRVQVGVKVRIGWVAVRVWVRFRSEMCKLHVHSLEIVQCIFQTVQIDK